MKTYKVNVNGTEYAISIELMSEEEAAAAKTAAPAQKASAPGAGEEITAPIRGHQEAQGKETEKQLQKAGFRQILDFLHTDTP